MSLALLHERSVLRIDGPEARAFLDNLVTNDLDKVTPERAGYGALLTPQGKIIADFFIVALPEADGGGFLLDVPLLQADTLKKRLSLYKLRAKVAIADLGGSAAVAVSDDGAPIPPETGVVFRDPRLAELGDRVILDRAEAQALAAGDRDAYQARRIALGVPEGGLDFAHGDAFPHEALMDQLGGVAFDKGCYVGQEVVSRMQHRGTARSRVVPVVFEDGLVPEDGVEAKAGDKVIGRLGTAAKGRGLALLRLDRVADAMAEGRKLTAGGLGFRLEKPEFARFPFPGEPEFGAARVEPI